MMEFDETIALSPSRPYVTAVEYPRVIVRPYAVVQLVCQVNLLHVCSPSQPFDWKKEQSQDPELREIIALIKGKSYTQGKLRRVILMSLRPFLE